MATPTTGNRPIHLETIRATELHQRGVTGRGIGIALLDTGVSTHAGEVPLRGLEGRVRGGINLTGVGERDDVDDWYGHGTFIAGLIAGDPAGSHPYEGFGGGVAPGAHIIPIKVAAPDGSTDVTNVIAGIMWAVAHRGRLGIRVLNLSFGTDSVNDWAVDPLNYAVERAWDEGIVVVVAAGNEGPDYATVSKPGDDPFVITVGASEHYDTPGVDDDHPERISSSGPVRGLLKPDVVAPGARLVSYRVPGSFVDVNMPQGRRPGTDWYSRATGTSFSAGLVSGAAALLLESHPDWGPDEVKAALTCSAVPVGHHPAPYRQGHGSIDVVAADDVDLAPVGSRVRLSPHRIVQAFKLSRGGLTLETEGGSQGGILDADHDGLPDGLVLDLTTFGSRGWTEAEWEELWGSVDWHPTHWQGHDWRHDGWTGHHWRGAHWPGHHWRGHEWWGHHWR